MATDAENSVIEPLIEVVVKLLINEAFEPNEPLMSAAVIVFIKSNEATSPVSYTHLTLPTSG